MLPLVSTLLPIGRGANHQWLKDAIKSTLSQQGCRHELIVFLDGYPHEDGDMAWTLVNKANIEMSSPEPLGIAKVLNEMLDAASGDYIARIDADDYSLPGRYERQIQMLQYCDIVGSALETKQGVIEAPFDTFDDIDKLLRKAKVPIYHPTLFAKAKVFTDVRYPTQYEWAEDYALHCLLHKRGFEFANVFEPLVHYRIHESQASQVHREAQKQATWHAMRDLL